MCHTVTQINQLMHAPSICMISAVPAVPPVATAGPSAAPPAGLTGSGVQTGGRPMRASRNPHPKYASAATREPEQGVGGVRGEPLSCLTVPKQRRASVRLAPSRQGSITPHGMADSAKTKTRAARAQARRRMRREMANAVRGREAAKAKGRWEAAGHGTVQCEQAQRCRKINGDMKAFAVAVASPDLHSRTLPPRTVVEALSRPDAARWQAAIDEELASCREFGVWEECVLPAGKQALPSRFVLERKRDGRYKARLVAGGHRQQYGLDFEDTFAPVCSYRTMRMILAVSAHENLVLRQFDVRTAFLNGELEEEVYVRPPPGAEHLAVGNKRVLRLRRALYGLKQASRAWNKRLEGELRAKGFEQSDAALWVLRGEGGAVLVMLYVDDGLVAAKIAAEADALVDLVGSMFEIWKLGEPQDFLGIHICRDRTRHFAVLLDVVRYVGGTASRGITYGGMGHPLGFWCDANFAACRDTRRSTTGWMVTMYGGAVSWSSKKQATAAASTMDAEYQACGAAAREGMSLRKALGEMALLSSDFLLGGRVIIRCDNKAALSLCKDRKEGQRVKHIDVIHHFARDHVASGELSFVYCKSEENVSDCLTKALSRPLFEKGLEGLGMICT
jgi:hypothetical protein